MESRPGHYTYVLITPARNEAQFIELTIKSVVEQTVRPVKWAIVSDGSTDGTDDIVSKYVGEHPWIELVRMPERSERHFAGKVEAFNAGYASMKDVPYDVIGSLDADISFDADYFSFLLGKLAEERTLGVVGSPFKDGATYDYRFVSVEHVSGACQVFRRECFEEIGGYMPMKKGGVDHAAVITARMKGWKTRTFTEKVCLHRRDLGSATSTAIMARFRDGAVDYALGGHPVWEIFRTIYQMTRRPVFAGGLMLLAGYLWSMVRRVERPVSREFVEFRRREQMRRLRRFLTGAKTEMSPESTVCEIRATKVVVKPWHGPHHIYGVFVVPVEYKDRKYSATVTVQSFRGKLYRCRIRHERADDIIAKPGYYAKRVYVQTRVALWFLITGRFGDLRAPRNWALVFAESSGRFAVKS